MNNIICVMLSGPDLTTKVAGLLLSKAQELRQGKINELYIKTNFCEGFIQTNWETKILGSDGGIFFQAEVHFADESTKVHFIVNPKVLDGKLPNQGQWVRSQINPLDGGTIYLN